MKICDRCGSKKEVSNFYFGLNTYQSGDFGSVKYDISTDLCKICRELILEFIKIKYDQT